MCFEGEKTAIEREISLKPTTNISQSSLTSLQTLSECMNVLKRCVPINDLDRTRHLDFITGEGF